MMITQNFYFVLFFTTFYHFCNVVCDSYIISPVKIFFLTRHFFRHWLADKQIWFSLFVILQLNSNSCVWEKQVCNLSLFTKSNINPTSSSFFCWSIKGNTFSVFTNLVRFEVMWALYWIHQACLLQIWVHFEQVFPQILRCFKVLQISNKIFGRLEIFAFRLVCMIPQDDNFINFENGTNSGNLTHKVGPEIRILRNFQDRIRETNGQMLHSLLLVEYNFVMNFLLLFDLGLLWQ